jgi:hypothetical protein
MASRNRTKNQKGARPAARGGRLLQPSADLERVSSSKAVKNAIAEKAGLALRDLIASSSEATLLNALAKRTAIDALIDLVSQNATALNAAVQTPDPLRAARSRAAQTMADLVRAEGGPLGVDEVAELLGISRAAVDKRRKNDALLGIQDGSRAVRYPSWQFTATGVLDGLPQALGAIGVKDPWMRLQFFLSYDGDLEATPLKALRSGRAKEVVSAAAKFGRQGEDA